MFVSSSKRRNLHNLLTLLFPTWQREVYASPADSTVENVLSHCVLTLADPVHVFFREPARITIYLRGISFVSTRPGRPRKSIHLVYPPTYRALGVAVEAELRWLREIAVPYIAGADTALRVLSRLVTEIAKHCEDSTVAEALLDSLRIVERLPRIESAFFPELDKVLVEYQVYPLTSYVPGKHRGPTSEIQHPQLEEIMQFLAEPLYIGAPYDLHLRQIDSSPLKKLQQELDKIQNITKTAHAILQRSGLLGEGYGISEIYHHERTLRFLYPRQKVLIGITPTEPTELTVVLFPRYITEHPATHNVSTILKVGDTKTKIEIPTTPELYTTQRQDLEQALEKAEEMLSAVGRKDKYRELTENIRNIEEYYKKRQDVCRDNT